ncbi:MAG TPA: HTTM domain-containing protein [Pyrinomonadaceae bacterium]|nr:HTTM domain-containing protein [Pyrinomonadaceae bacterium]
MSRLFSGSALSLGIVRSIVSGTFLIGTIATSFSALGQLPVTILRPTGLMKLLPWSFYDRLLTPAGMYTLKTAMLLSLGLSTFGFLTSLSSKCSLLLVIFYQGLVRSFAHYNHDEMLAVYYLVVLAFTPCGDSFSIDHWLRRKNPNQPLFAYGFPVFLMQMLMAWVYFSSALVKLRVAGWKYLSEDNFPVLAIFHSLGNLHDTSFRLAFWLPQIRGVLPYVIALVLLWELLFPLAVVWRRIRWLMLGFGILFHLATLFFMNIFFPYQLTMYLVFVDWDKVAKWFNHDNHTLRAAVR